MSSDPEKEPIEKKSEEQKSSEDKPAAAKPTPKPAATKPAAKKEEPELPAFEKGLADKITEKFGEKTTVSYVKPDRIGIKVGKDDLHDVAEFARDVLNYDHVESVAGVDYPSDKEIEVVYHLSSYTDPTLSRQVLELATRAQREEDPIPGNDATKLKSLRDVFYSVEFHEREVFEMLGVYFEGHPDNRRLLLPEDWADLPPLRKDFRIKGR
ncbi:MAG: NADH-quinone oxidoreductase subunit C [Nitrososphaeria archaeon]|nr:NADH-quinone oxidoreductase subunit C [Nitrosopumilaceae archaeon]NIP10028.1 NADH-quinone oxidoreductase subunit C [Nitrosopumilaceae archaeon]NIP91005.1 NADH-quinone oxidoreductase subunit C [Nitrososphaeria archaeon]NIS94824.1 NADH-quinone oxidoreductase subunit C [Nitrosopumilaceae archaeon]